MSTTTQEKSRRGRPRLQLDEPAIVEAYVDGESVTGIARRLGVDRAPIRRVLDEADVPRRDDRGAHWAHKRAHREAS